MIRISVLDGVSYCCSVRGWFRPRSSHAPQYVLVSSMFLADGIEDAALGWITCVGDLGVFVVRGEKT